MENLVMTINPLEDGDQENRSCFSGLSRHIEFSEEYTVKNSIGGKENILNPDCA